MEERYEMPWELKRQGLALTTGLLCHSPEGREGDGPRGDWGQREVTASPRTLQWGEEKPALGDERKPPNVSGSWDMVNKGQRSGRRAWAILCWALGSVLTVLGMAKAKQVQYRGFYFFLRSQCRVMSYSVRADINHKRTETSSAPPTCWDFSEQGFAAQFAGRWFCTLPLLAGSLQWEPLLIK